MAYGALLRVIGSTVHKLERGVAVHKVKVWAPTYRHVDNCNNKTRKGLITIVISYTTYHITILCGATNSCNVN